MINKRIFISIVLLLVLLCLMINKKEKFFEEEEPLYPPVIIKASKKKTDAFIEWYNDNKNINTFILLYIDVDTIDNGIWVQREIKCNKKTCKIILRDLLGTRYKVAVLSSKNNKVSDISNIASFSDDEDYTNVAVSSAPALVADGNDNELIFLDEEAEISPTESDLDNTNQNNTDTSNLDKMGMPPQSSSPPKPSIICDDGLGLRQINIKNKKDLEEAQVKNECNDNVDFKELDKFSKKVPFYHYYWDKIF